MSAATETNEMRLLKMVAKIINRASGPRRTTAKDIQVCTVPLALLLEAQELMSECCTQPDTEIDLAEERDF